MRCVSAGSGPVAKPLVTGVRIAPGRLLLVEKEKVGWVAAVLAKSKSKGTSTRPPTKTLVIGWCDTDSQVRGAELLFFPGGADRVRVAHARRLVAVDGTAGGVGAVDSPPADDDADLERPGEGGGRLREPEVGVDRPFAEAPRFLVEDVREVADPVGPGGRPGLPFLFLAHFVDRLRHFFVADVGDRRAAVERFRPQRLRRAGPLRDRDPEHVLRLSFGFVRFAVFPFGHGAELEMDADRADPPRLGKAQRPRLEHRTGAEGEREDRGGREGKGEGRFSVAENGGQDDLILRRRSMFAGGTRNVESARPRCRHPDHGWAIGFRLLFPDD